MKPTVFRPILIAWGSLWLTASWAIGQEAFIFVNYVPGRLDAPVFDELGQRLYGSNYVAMLYGGLTPEAMYPARWPTDIMPPVPFIYTPEGRTGYFRLGGYVVVGRDPNLGCGFPMWLQVRAWDRRLGETWEEAVASGRGYGASEPFLLEGGSICMPDPSPPVYLIGLKSFSLVPEPPILALAALSGLVLAWSGWRRLRNPGAARSPGPKPPPAVPAPAPSANAATGACGPGRPEASRPPASPPASAAGTGLDPR